LNSIDRVCAPPLAECVEVIPLSSDGSASTEFEPNLTQNSKGKLPVCDEDLVPSEQPVKPAKINKLCEQTYKFQDTWAARLPWADLCRGSDGLYESVKCTICSTITGKPKILVSKYDTLEKHGGKRMATRNMANGIKKGQRYVSKNYKYLHFECIYASRSVVIVVQQLSVVKGECGRKRQQMAAIVHLLQE
jgi:hypothetical protein